MIDVCADVIVLGCSDLSVNAHNKGRKKQSLTSLTQAKL
jgi:hypothetical protein